MQRMSYGKPSYDNKEEFDPSLQTLSTVDKAVAFCDGLYMEKARNNETIKINEAYPDIVSSVIRKRFYHGYSMYGFSNNYMAMMVSGVIEEGLSAIVVPDDILKYPYAACSQQSIVFMEILNRKGFPTRKVEFKGKKNGHFCFEVYYNNGWHFYDPDMEPSVTVLAAYNRPGISFLAKHPDILGGLPPVINPATVGGSTRYRLALGPLGSRDKASSICNSLVSAGERDCLVRKQ